MKKLERRLLVLSFLALLATAPAVSAGGEGGWPGVAVSADGTPVSYEVFGKGEPTLVFVHGWSCDSRYWREQAGPFSSKHRVVLVDLAGHGNSGTDRKRFTMRAFGQDVRAVADAVGAREMILIGHSMGGGVIAEAAAMMPGRVIGLVGVDTLEDVGYKASGEEIARLVAPLREDFRKGTRQFVARMIFPGTGEELREFILSDMSSAPPAVAMSAIDEYLVQYVDGSSASVFEKVRVPVFSVNGEISPPNFENNRRVMLSYDAVVIKGGDHFLMMAMPGEFNAALGKAIETVVSKTARPSTAMPPEANRMKPGDAPTPYSAEQIGKALPRGSWISFRDEAEGKDPSGFVFRFGKGDRNGVKLETFAAGEDGKAAGRPAASEPGWKELQSHASFPEAATRVGCCRVKTFKGDLDCWLYEVKEGETVTMYWFAKELPGPPVLLEEYREGKLARKMTMTGRGKD